VMTAEELRILASRPGHAIGGHTTNHLALTRHGRDVKQREISGDKAALERALGQRVTLFSYPYGDVDAETARVVREAGYRAAVTVEAGAVSVGGDRLLLPRYEVPTRERVDLASRLRAMLQDGSARLQPSGSASLQASGEIHA